jgi:hypothetical protein
MLKSERVKEYLKRVGVCQRVARHGKKSLDFCFHPKRAYMTDYAEEQAHELEALESIYPDEFEVLDEGKQFQIAIHPDVDVIEDEPPCTPLNAFI